MRAMRAVLVVLAMAAGLGAAPATKPAATQPNQPLVAFFERLPKDLWPSPGESVARETSRITWVRDNFPKGTLNYVGTIRSVMGAGRGAQRGGRATTPGKIHVLVDLEPLSVWGSHTDVNLVADIGNLNPDLAAKWEVGDRIGLAGVGTIRNDGISRFTIELPSAIVSSMPTKVAKAPATKPAVAGKFQSFEELVASVPENLWPSDSESTLHRQARQKWVTDNIVGKTFGPWDVSGTIKDVTQAMQGGRVVVVVQLTPQVMTIEGQSAPVDWRIVTTNSVEEAMNWKGGTKVSGRGTATISNPGALYGVPGPVTIMVEGAKVEVHD